MNDNGLQISCTTRPPRASWNRSSAPRTVHKFPVACFNKIADLDLPKGATVLSAVLLNYQLYIYAEVDMVKQTEETERYQFQAVGTGRPIYLQSPRVFVGTIVLQLRTTLPEIYHIYYRKS